jgi:hypothetical protein
MRVSIARVCSYGLGIVLALHSIGSVALATPAIAPEIDGSSMSAGLGLLAAGVLLLRARKAR